MFRTISIKLNATHEQNVALLQLQKQFNDACNNIVPVAIENRCWNRVALHHLAYYKTRETTNLGSQMVCNAIKAVCESLKALNALSLYTLSGRILIPMVLGEFQQQYLERGTPKEAELVCKNKTWFFNLVLELPSVDPIFLSENVLGVDLGENNLAALSSGKLFGGGQTRHKRDRALALRSRLQSNGSKSAKQLLKKISGKEARHMTQVNHEISKMIVKEAIDTDCGTIAMEDLTNIRKRIKANKRIRSRLHRWAWAQLQMFVKYKAEAVGLKILFVNPAYTSQMCANCEQIGTRNKHRLICKICGIQRHSDLNASLNIRRIALSADNVTGAVSRPYVATS